ncbi:MAG: hypothetical protein ACR652_11565 [Methylocystis sp.]|uniref:hypothetical protein n=1 Tax=Methylocystis sp. TaxID=1911079 RepID=UPI003DA2E79D
MKLRSPIIPQISAERDRREIDRQWRAAKCAILAYHVGCWRKGESPLDALARASNVAEETSLVPSSHTAKQVELALLFKCLGIDWEQRFGFDLKQSIDLVIRLLNEKLAVVPPEVRAFFGSPVKLKSELLSSYSLRDIPDTETRH